MTHCAGSRYDVKSDTGIVFYWLIGAVVAVSFGDIFSEKLALCTSVVLSCYLDGAVNVPQKL